MTSKWEAAYKKEGFKIQTNRASKIVKNINKHLLAQSYILDLGCGAGRNARFFATQGHKVVALDIVDLNFLRKLLQNTQNNIDFIKISVLDWQYPIGLFDVVIAARLLQYLPIRNVSSLLRQIAKSLKSGGWLGISYTISGGILDGKLYGMDKYIHSIDKIKYLLKLENFKIVFLEKCENINSDVPHSLPVTAVDIIARKN